MPQVAPKHPIFQAEYLSKVSLDIFTQVTYTKDWAQDLLARDGVDIKEGGLDRSTRFMHAQTLDDINDDGVKALRNAVRRTAPFFHPNETTGGISEKYAEETKKKNAHFYGDKR